MEDNNKPMLESASFKFEQTGNCRDTAKFETLTIECKSEVGIDRTDGCFYVIKTEQWSFDSIKELKEIVDRIDKAINNS